MRLNNLNAPVLNVLKTKFNHPFIKGLDVSLRPLDCWDCGFESRRRHGCLSVVSVVCCQVEVSATGRSLVQRSPIECGVSECDFENSAMRPGPTRAVEPLKKIDSVRTGQ